MTMALLVLMLATLIIASQAQIEPLDFTFESSEAWAMNGSSPYGNCNVTSNGDGSISTCTEPRKSVLFDRNIPTLTGLNGNTWARDLLTLSIGSASTSITFDYNYPSRRAFYVARIEVAMFNCPQWGISIKEVRLSLRNSQRILGPFYPLATSCDSLVRVCIPYIIDTRQEITLQFISDTGSDWLHLAEVEFYCIGFTCPSPAPPITTTTTITTPTAPPPPTTTTITPTPPPPTTTTTTAAAATSSTPMLPTTFAPSSSDETTELNSSLEATQGYNNTGESTDVILDATQSGSCVSCTCLLSTILSSIFTAIIIGLLATVTFVMVQFIVQRKKRKIKVTSSKLDGPTANYEEMCTPKLGGPIYDEVCEAKRGAFPPLGNMKMSENEAYGEQVKTRKIV